MTPLTLSAFYSSILPYSLTQTETFCLQSTVLLHANLSKIITVQGAHDLLVIEPNFIYWQFSGLTSNIIDCRFVFPVLPCATSR